MRLEEARGQQEGYALLDGGAVDQPLLGPLHHVLAVGVGNVEFVEAQPGRERRLVLHTEESRIPAVLMQDLRKGTNTRAVLETMVGQPDQAVAVRVAAGEQRPARRRAQRGGGMRAGEQDALGGQLVQMRTGDTVVAVGSQTTAQVMPMDDQHVVRLRLAHATCSRSVHSVLACLAVRGCPRPVPAHKGFAQPDYLAFPPPQKAECNPTFAHRQHFRCRVTLAEMTLRTRWAVIAAVGAVIVYAAMWIGYVQNWAWLDSVDTESLRFFYDFGATRSGWVSFWNIFCTVFGPTGFRLMALVLVVVAVLRRDLRTALFLVLSVGMTGLVTEVFKRIAGRPRPVTAMTEATSSSFPSGHALGVMVGCWPS